MNAQHLIGFLAHLAIIGSVLVKGAYLTKPILNAATSVEGLIRGSAAASGVMLAAIMRSADLLYAALVVAILDRWYLYYPLGVVLPIVAGVMIARFVSASMERNTNLAIRVVVLIGAFSLAQFIELYVTALARTSIAMSRVLAPNLIFALAITLYFVFNYDVGRGDSKG